MNELNFNPNSPSIMHIDLNSCFASVEQQANPFLRGKPIAVAAYNSPNGCILAPSIEAKRYGVKTGMRVKEAKSFYPALIILEPDPPKYRDVHLKFRKLLFRYTPYVYPKSIDEFVLDLSALRFSTKNLAGPVPPCTVGIEIKQNIKKEIGDWLTVSIGISTNRFLAKLASNLKKPDGLETISKENFLKVYEKLSLTDLPYIKKRNALRLASVGIYNVVDFYGSDIKKLKAAFHSINGYYWYMRLRGLEIDAVPFGRRSYGNSYSLPKPFSVPKELAPILTKLTTKTTSRFRKDGYQVGGVYLAIRYRDGNFWQNARSLERKIFTTNDVYKELFKLLLSGINAMGLRPVRNLAISCFDLTPIDKIQLELFEDTENKFNLTRSIDEINTRWGDYVVTPAQMAWTSSYVPDRIAFGLPAIAEAR